MADDDLDYQDDDFEEETEDSVEDTEDEEGSGSGSASRARTESAEELAEAAASAHSALAARNKMREAMQSEVEAFLAKGGKIQQIDDNVMADPPKKPSSNYGSQPI